MGSEGLGHVLSAARNLSIDLLDSSDLLKYNIMNYASGSYMHPLDYQWQQHEESEEDFTTQF